MELPCESEMLVGKKILAHDASRKFSERHTSLKLGYLEEIFDNAKPQLRPRVIYRHCKKQKEVTLSVTQADGRPGPQALLIG